MNKLKFFALLLTILSVFSLTGCDFISQVPQSTPLPTPQPSIEPTATPAPSPTVSPTVTPEPTPEREDLSQVWSLILVNDYVKLPDDYTFEQGSYSDMIVDARILDELTQMISDAGADGVSLWISSTYRDNELQGALYDRRVNTFLDEGYSQEDAEIQAAAWVKPAGHSEHATGLAIDFNGVRSEFEFEPGYTWLMENAADYGFILRYDKDTRDITGVNYEPWHFRYVGVPYAQEIVDLGVTLEEYLADFIAVG